MVSASHVEDHIRTVFLPVAFVRLIGCSIIIWLLKVEMRFQSNVVQKGDPCPNGNILVMLLLFIDIQRVVFAIGELFYFRGMGTDQVDARTALKIEY